MDELAKVLVEVGVLLVHRVEDGTWSPAQDLVPVSEFCKLMDIGCATILIQLMHLTELASSSNLPGLLMRTLAVAWFPRSFWKSSCSESELSSMFL